MALTKDEKRQLDDVIKGNGEIHTALVGLDGKGGLIQEVKDLARSHYALKRKVYMAGAVVAAAYGGITAFIVKVINGV